MRRITHAVFAIIVTGWGILGLIKGDFAPGWQPVPESMPARQALAYLCAFVCIACGVGLLWQRSAGLAARILFAWLAAWLLFLRVPWMLVSFGVNTWWSASSTAMLTATAWILFLSCADDRDGRYLGPFTGDTGLRIARALFGVGLIPIGLAHFLYLDATSPLVPAWLLWPVFWSYFTGGTFIAAGLAMIIGVFARLAAMLVTLQIGLLTLLVWIPIVMIGHPNAFQWSEVVVSIVLTSAAWVVTDFYRDTPWLSSSLKDSRGLR